MILQATVKLAAVFADIASLIGDRVGPGSKQVNVLVGGRVIDRAAFRSVYEENRLHGHGLGRERAAVNISERNELQVVRIGLSREAIYFAFPSDRARSGLITESPCAVIERLDKVRLLGKPQNSPIFYDSIHSVPSISFYRSGGTRKDA